MELLEPVVKLVTAQVVGILSTLLSSKWGWATMPIWSFPVCWVIYGWAMGLKRSIRERGGFRRLNLITQLCYVILGGPMLVVGLLLDYYINFVIMTPLLWRFPRFYTGRLKGIPWAWPRLTSSRLSDHYEQAGRRGKIAKGLCDIFLHPFDKEHCT